MATQVTSQYPNLYSFFTGWDGGVKADRDAALEKRTQTKFDLELPTLNLQAEKATSELDNFLLNSEVRKQQQQFANTLASQQINARQGLLPAYLDTINTTEAQRLRGLQQGLTGESLAQDSTARIQALRQQYPELTDAQLRKLYAEIYGLGGTPAGLDTVLPGITATQRAALPTGVVTSRLVDPLAAAASDLTKQENLMLQGIKANQAQQTATAKEAAAMERQVAVEQAKGEQARQTKGAIAAPKAGAMATSAASDGQLMSLTGTAPTAQSAVGSALQQYVKPTPAQEQGVRTSAALAPETVAEVTKQLRVLRAAQAGGIPLSAADVAQIQRLEALRTAHLLAGGKP